MLLDKRLKKLVSEQCSTVKVLKGPKHCWNLHDSTFIIFFLSLWRKLSWKRSLLVTSEMLGLFVNTLTPNDKYSLRNSENLRRQPIQIAVI